MKSLVKFFDKLEDKTRTKLSGYPLVYALIGGVAIVLFWRGIWHMADDFSLSWQISLLLSVIILLLTGLFVSFFVGENIILTGIKHEKKMVEKAETEIKTESDDLAEMRREMNEIKRDISDIKNALIKK